MTKIEPTGTTDAGYTHNINMDEIKIDSMVKFFSQSFKIESFKKGVFAGTSNYKNAPKNNKSGSVSSGEHNLIFISPQEVWRIPIGGGGERHV